MDRVTINVIKCLKSNQIARVASFFLENLCSLKTDLPVPPERLSWSRLKTGGFSKMILRIFVFQICVIFFQQSIKLEGFLPHDILSLSLVIKKTSKCTSFFLKKIRVFVMVLVQENSEIGAHVRSQLVISSV